MKRGVFSLLIIFIGVVNTLCYSKIYLIQSDSNIIGQYKSINIEPGTSLSEVARHYNVAYQLLTNLNPMLVSKKINYAELPSEFILPPQVGKGIVVNLAQYRLYYQIPGAQEVISGPVAIGKKGWRASTEATKVLQKQEHPDWVVPQTLVEEAKHQGKHIPAIIKAGPDNPLGDYALKLALPGYFVHGTNTPATVGKRVNYGCIRMYPEDIEELFPIVSVGTSVHIVYEPILVGWRDNELYLEVHRVHHEFKKLSESSFEIAKQKLEAILSNHPNYPINWHKVKKIVETAQGLPVRVN